MSQLFVELTDPPLKSQWGISMVEIIIIEMSLLPQGRLHVSRHVSDFLLITISSSFNRSWRADRSTREWNCLALLHPSPPHHLSPGPILHLCCKTDQLIERKAHHSRSCKLSAVWRIAPGGGTSLNYMHCSTQPHTFCSDGDD